MYSKNQNVIDVLKYHQGFRGKAGLTKSKKKVTVLSDTTDIHREGVPLTHMNTNHSMKIRARLIHEHMMIFHYWERSTGITWI